MASRLVLPSLIRRAMQVFVGGWTFGAGQDNGVERAVQLPVAAAGKPVPGLCLS